MTGASVGSSEGTEERHAPAEPWYASGLRFECTRCGKCCRGAPGTVRVVDDEIAALSRRLGIGVGEFRRRYTKRLSDGTLGLRERGAPGYECVFYDHDRGCTVYEDRPRQCRTYPFWQSIASSRATWAAEALECPGIDRGRVHTLEEIEARLRDDGTSRSRGSG